MSRKRTHGRNRRVTTDGGTAGRRTPTPQLKAILEAIVYVTDEPLSAQQIAAALERPIDVVKRLLDELVAEFAAPGAWPEHPRGRGRLQDGHQGRASRSRARVREEADAAAEAVAGGAGNAGGDRLQAAGDRARDHGDPRRAGRGRAEDPARPQADRGGRPQERGRQADPLQDHQGVSGAVRLEGSDASCRRSRNSKNWGGWIGERSGAPNRRPKLPSRKRPKRRPAENA